MLGNAEPCKNTHNIIAEHHSTTTTTTTTTTTKGKITLRSTGNRKNNPLPLKRRIPTRTTIGSRLSNYKAFRIVKQTLQIRQSLIESIPTNEPCE
jgi:hypothetical protein